MLEKIKKFLRLPKIIYQTPEIVVETANQQNRLILQQSDFVYTLTHTTANVRHYVKFFCPDYPYEIAQKIIVNGNHFYSQNELFALSSLLPQNPVIIDVGANIGSYSLYWGLVCKAQKIHAFEPLPITYDILQKNIELNNLQDVVIPHCAGVGEKNSKGGVAYANATESTSTVILASDDGAMEIIALDDMDLLVDKIDLIKIDAEGMEYEVLKGCIKTIQKYTPMISVEIFSEEMSKNSFFKGKEGQHREALFKIPPKENHNNITQFLEKLDYQFFKQTDDTNYVFNTQMSYKV